MQFLKGFDKTSAMLKTIYMYFSHAYNVFTGCKYATIVAWCSPGNGT